MKNTGNRLKSFNAGVGPDGEVTFNFQRADNTQASISVPFVDLTNFIMGLEAKAGEALSMMNSASRGGDRRLMMPIRKQTVTKVQCSMAQGVPILSLELNERLVLDMAVPSDLGLELIEYLQELQSQASTAPPKSN